MSQTTVVLEDRFGNQDHVPVDDPIPNWILWRPTMRLYVRVEGHLYRECDYREISDTMPAFKVIP